MNEATPPALPGQKAKVILNAAIAGILSLFAVWMTVADFSHGGDLLFQSSPSLLLAALFTSFLFLVLVVLAALPKGMIIGANLLVLARCAMGFPLNIWLGNTTAPRVVSVAFLILSLAYLGMSLAKTKGISQRPWIQGRHSIIAGVAWLLITVASLPYWLLGYASAAQNLVGDYLRLRPTQLDLVERVFEKDGQRVHLVGMMHIGDGVFYNNLKTRMNAAMPPGEKRLVLTEGVSDRDHLIPPDFANGKTYERWAKLLGLETQKRFHDSKPGDPVEPTPDAAGNPSITWQNADGDIADLQPKHRELLLDLLKSLSTANIADLMNSKAAKASGADMEDLMKNGLIITRNDVLMDHFKDMAAGYQEIYIPWGAAHLPDIEQRLVAMGYKKTEDFARPIVRFVK